MYKVEVNTINTNHNGLFEFDSAHSAAKKIVGNVYGFDYEQVVSDLLENKGEWSLFHCNLRCGVVYAKKVN